MTSDEIVKLIEQQGADITSDMISDIIDNNTETASKLQKLWEEYKGDVPIKSRTFEDTNKVNNQLLNHFRKTIVDQFVGYGFGHEIGYNIDTSAYSQSDYDLILNEINKFKKRNKIKKLDIETARYQSACGVAYRLAYIDREGKERVMNLAPWEVIYIEDKSINELQLALVYYPVEYTNGKGESVIKTKVEVYDRNTVTYYIEENNSYVLDVTELVNPQPHLFDYVPIMRFQNDNLNKSDFEDVSDLIDAYDLTLSDAQNEWESFRLAYLAVKGVSNITAEIVKQFKQTGVFEIPENGDVKFVTKDLNDNFLENHKKTLEKNIYRFSNTVDFSDEAFSGTSVSGESRKYKLQSLENKTIVKELEFSSGLTDMFKIITTAWQKKGIKLNYEDIDFTFTRNLPVELATSADMAQKLNGIVSKKTIYSLMPFIKDADTEMEQMMEEQSQSSLNLDDFNFSPSGSAA